MWVDHKGSAKYKISGQQLLGVLQQAFAAWTNTDCGKSTPTIAVGKLALLEDDDAVALGLMTPTKSSSDDPSVTTSITAFVDEGWMKESADAIALTTTSFGTKSGRIFGSDIELDSTDFRFTLSGDTSPDNDLLAVLTHETGHVFGLADLMTPGPTMYGQYTGHGNVDPRTLESDDVAGICSIYPADRFDHNTAGCGCRLGAAGSETPGSLGCSGLTVLAICVQRRRSRRKSLIRMFVAR